DPAGAQRSLRTDAQVGLPVLAHHAEERLDRIEIALLVRERREAAPLRAQRPAVDAAQAAVVVRQVAEAAARTFAPARQAGDDDRARRTVECACEGQPEPRAKRIARRLVREVECEMLRVDADARSPVELA